MRCSPYAACLFGIAAAVVAAGAGDATDLRPASAYAAIGLGAVSSEGVSPKRSDTTVVQATRPTHGGVGRLVEELSIGSIDGAQNYLLGQVTSVAVAGDGSIYIADELSSDIKVYDRAGRFIRSIGRSGMGPGEFGLSQSGFGGAATVAGPRAIALLREGGLVAQSFTGRRINIYNALGAPELTRSDPRITIRRPSPMGPPLLVAATGDVIYVRYDSPFGNYRRTPLRPTPPGHYGRWKPRGNLIDTLVDPVHRVGPQVVYSGPYADPRRSLQVPFSPDFTWTLSPLGYFVTGYPADRRGHYSIEFRFPVRRGGNEDIPRWQEGDPVTSVRVPFSPVRAGTEERRDWEAALTASMREVRQDRGWRWNGPPIPVNKAPYKRLWADNEGRIWVLLHSAAKLDPTAVRNPRSVGRYASDRWPEPQRFDIVTPTGVYVGQVQSLERIWPQVARGDHLWAIVETEWGPITVKRYRIVWNAAS